MRIFHGPNNISGSAGVLARAQRGLGHDAEAVCFDTGTYRFTADRLMQPKGLRLIRALPAEGLTFDVFHFYFGQSLAGSSLYDVKWLRRIGKKVYFYFCGCDIRDSKAVVAAYQFSACKECWPMACSSNRKLALQAARESDGIFVSTPDLLEFVPGATWLPQPIELSAFDKLADKIPVQNRHTKNTTTPIVRVAHAPSSRMLKGTTYLEKAIERIRVENKNAELILIEGKSHIEAMGLCLGADVAVDQLLIGAYGQFAVEMMALGKPVICYIRDDLRSLYPKELPIISANPETIEAVLRELARFPDRWDAIGQRGRAYVERYHGADVVAQIALDHYLS